jgi:hypothetical protein
MDRITEIAFWKDAKVFRRNPLPEGGKPTSVFNKRFIISILTESKGNGKV